MLTKTIASLAALGALSTVALPGFPAAWRADYTVTCGGFAGGAHYRHPFGNETYSGAVWFDGKNQRARRDARSRTTFRSVVQRGDSGGTRQWLRQATTNLLTGSTTCGVDSASHLHEAWWPEAYVCARGHACADEARPLVANTFWTLVPTVSGKPVFLEASGTGAEDGLIHSAYTSADASITASVRPDGVPARYTYTCRDGARCDVALGASLALPVAGSCRHMQVQFHNAAVLEGGIDPAVFTPLPATARGGSSCRPYPRDPQAKAVGPSNLPALPAAVWATATAAAAGATAAAAAVTIETSASASASASARASLLDPKSMSAVTAAAAGAAICLVGVVCMVGLLLLLAHASKKATAVAATSRHLFLHRSSSISSSIGSSRASGGRTAAAFIGGSSHRAQALPHRLSPDAALLPSVSPSRSHGGGSFSFSGGSGNSSGVASSARGRGALLQMQVPTPMPVVCGVAVSGPVCPRRRITTTNTSTSSSTTGNSNNNRSRNLHDRTSLPEV